MKKILLQIYFNKALALPLVIILSLVLIMPMFSGCGGEAASNTFIELFNLVPAAAAGTEPLDFITFTDLASYYRDFDITFTNFEELTEKLISNNVSLFLGSDTHITGWSRFAQTSTIQDKYVGYNISNIDAEIVFGFQPFSTVAAIGRFDPQATKNALSNQDDWPDWAKTAYTTEEYQGVTIHSWGDGFETHIANRLMPPHIDVVGRARPLALTERHLFYAPSLEAIKLMIDASKNKYTSLADLPEYAAIANGLADLKAYTAIMGDAPLVNVVSNFQGPNIKLTQEQLEQLTKQWTKLKNFLTFGSGVGRDEKGFYTAIIMYHKNSADALANVTLLKQHIETDNSLLYNKPWSETITASDIRAEGELLLAKLYSSTGLWESWVYYQDNLLFHEE